MGKTITKEKINLLLCCPPLHGNLEGFTLGLYDIKNYLRNKIPNLNAEILDLGNIPTSEVEKEIKNRIKSLNYEHLIFGVTASTATYQSALYVLRTVKNLFPNTITMIGGRHIKSQEKICLQTHPEVDIVIKNEGEISALSIVNSINTPSKWIGCAYKDKLGKIKIKKNARFLNQKELDSLEPLISSNQFRTSLGKFNHMTYLFARGCPFSCAYCSVNREEIRSKSIPVIIRDLKNLVLKGNYKYISFENNFFTHYIKDTIDLCKSIILEKNNDKKFQFEWDCQTRVEWIQEIELLKWMKEAGCSGIYLGVENFSPRLLTYLGKTHDPKSYIEKIKKAAENLGLLKIGMFINLQLGIPDETRHDQLFNIKNLIKIAKTYKMYGGSDLVVFPHLSVIYPGTLLYYDMISTGVPNDIFEYYTLWEKNHPSWHDWISSVFAHGNGGIPLGIISFSDLMKRNIVFNERKITKLKKYIEDVNNIPNIEVFDYSKFVVKENSSNISPISKIA